ncbi:cytochrome P450 [Suillus paluster]|uniref:cytochrome P450 n=1 Tax=Suillus paluster TaxID=48578 RepID=UPI001B8603A1|nr:cytochrome P450 [Suillus paluster]KAG1748411.1 cytochrome P450 [Suillus paluster]
MLQLPDLRIFDNTQLILGAAACLGVVGVILKAYLSKSGSRLPLPPSPPTRRFWGHDVPIENPCLTVGKWIDEYGPLVTIRVGPHKMVIIGRYNAAVDIMEKHGSSLADRPRLVAAGDILTGGMSIILTHVGNRLRRMRRVLHSHLQPRAAAEYQPLQMLHAKSTVLNILKDPLQFPAACRNVSAALDSGYHVIMKVAYGKNTPTAASDPEIEQIREHIQFLGSLLRRPGSYWADFIPWLQYIPSYGRELKQRFMRNKQLYTSQLNRVKQQISNVDAGPSFGRHMLENAQDHGLPEMDMAFLAGSFFAAGSDTTTLAICTALMAAARFPDEQAKVQAEIDAVVGRERAPTFTDFESLPHLHAFVIEALRWRPLIPSGVAHRATEDVIWGDYCIPAGTIVFGNHWDDIKQFFTYGFGRRVCPGQHIANRSVFINLLLILWAFELTLNPKKPLDDMGFMRGESHPGIIDFKAKFPDAEIKRMLRASSDVAGEDIDT